MTAYVRSVSIWDNFGKFIHQFQPETKTLIRKLKRILKLYKQNVSLLFNQTCLNERLLPNYTYKHLVFKVCQILWNIFFFRTATLYDTDHVYIYNFWYNFISLKDKMLSISTFSNVLKKCLMRAKSLYSSRKCLTN